MSESGDCKKQIAALEADLQRLRDQVEGMRTQLQQTEVVADVQESGMDLAERQILQSQISALESRVAQLELGLRHNKNGQGGKCAGCGELIEPERLETLGVATTSCSRCAHQAEVARRR